ncbi:MAG: UDP-3-O-(3-hydroxymyristoyl)glucosamine N-acyltransferase [Zoogloeaceae bacterium]|jgi:UDP-3-O-[3-hydroxymyristoyl] glucosamine N-acyltransferase|nr:UDP-3-O-(3-hydroxymyristoyl)glucosamine N-acyltransferase [Zoogloeaceae bacterium]
MKPAAGVTTWTLAAIVARLGGEAQGEARCAIRAVAPLKNARAGEIAFFAQPRFRAALATTQASAVILRPEEASRLPPGLAAILTPNPYAYYARLTALLHPPPRHTPGVHPSAVVESEIPASCHVGAGAVIGPGVRLGERVTVHAHAVIGADVEIGEQSVIHAHVVIYPGCRIGARAILHGGAVIGADGFGFAPDFSADGAGAWVKIPQIGRVVIGDDVEVGANTSIDRGALEDTVIGDGVKLDNQIQIGHNCVIGEHTVIAGCAGIAGSTRIGHHSAIGGAAMILGHLHLAPHTEISPGTMVMKSLAEAGKYTALYPLETHQQWLRNAAHLRRLGDLARRVAELEETLAKAKKD